MSSLIAKSEWSGVLLGDVHRVDGRRTCVRIWEFDVVGGCGAKYLLEMLGKVVAERDETGLVPIDHGLKKIDDDEALHVLVFQGLGGRIAQPQPADDDIQLTLERGQPKYRELPLGLGKEARHQVFLAELYLKNF